MKIDYLINNQDKKSLGCFVKKKKKKNEREQVITWSQFAGMKYMIPFCRDLGSVINYS